MSRVTVGIPTYNGVQYISECLQALADQDFDDFEVVISDNASTDGTSDICADFAARDSRFRHLRAQETVPALDNFRRCLDLSQSPYFMWRADDDLSEKNGLSSLAAALDRNRVAALAVSATRRITFNPPGSPVETTLELPVVTGMSRQDRVREILLGCRPSWIYGLWRREDALQSLGLTRRYPYLWAWDHLVLLPAILNNRVELVPHGGAFIQRLTKDTWYRLLPSELLAARKSYVGIAEQLFGQADWNEGEQKVIRAALKEHFNRRVAPLPKTYRRYIEERLLRLVGRTYRTRD